MFTPEPGFPLGDIPAAHAAERPDAVAVRAGDAELTWEELHRASDAAARGLKLSGVERGHIVPLMLPNGVDVVVAAFACLKLGAVPQPLSTRLAPAEERAILALSEPPVVVGLQGARPDRSTTVAELRRLGSGEGELTTEIGPSWKAPTSGGSTGRPKIILSGAEGAFNPFDMEAWGLRPGEQSLITAPSTTTRPSPRP
ncbi:AMP-binding protein [Streptomyces bauhiniae]|uniref:AMP-binding protein n=1 Tax=Streptomyces bauhiniae TaxID=2340725 RepID=UPI0034530250